MERVQREKRGTFGSHYFKDQLMHTSTKTWSFLSNYKGVCSVFLWGCPAALLTLWGLCFSHFLPPTSISISPSLPLSPTLFFRICTPTNPCSFLPPNWRACLLYLFICFSPPFSFILSFFYSYLSSAVSPLLSPTHSPSQFIPVLHCIAVWIWTVCCVKRLVAHSVQCRVSESMTVYFAAITHVHQLTKIDF